MPREPKPVSQGDRQAGATVLVQRGYAGRQVGFDGWLRSLVSAPPQEIRKLAGTFTAQLRGNVEKYKRRLDVIVKQSAQDVIEIAQTPQPSVTETGGFFTTGQIPVDTGFLRNSLVSTVNGAQIAGGADSYVLAIAGAEAGDVLAFGWTAAYAPLIEYGTSKIAPRAFVREAVMQWQAIVDANVRRASQS